MILNIIDRRKRKHRWQRVNAVLENTWQDNGCADADQARTDCADQCTYDERFDISVADAVAWGMAEKAEVTLFLYNQGEGIGMSRKLSDANGVAG